MSAPQIPEETVEAAIKAWHAQYDEPWPDTPPWLRKAIGDELAAAYPHLRRAIIAELIEKAETEVLPLDPYAGCPNTYGAFQRSARTHIIGWLRAELEEGDGE